MNNEKTPLVVPGNRNHQSALSDLHVKEKKKKLTLLHVMFAFEIAFFVFVVARSHDVISHADAGKYAAVPVLQIIWFIGVAYLGRTQQFFTQSWIQKRFPIFWVPMFVLLVQLAVFGSLHKQTAAILEYLPRSTFVGLQVMRTLAVGSLIKWHHGIFPFAFAWLTALPDMLFGISAIVLLAQKEWMMNNTILAIWNLVGFVLIVPIGAIVLQLGMAPTELYSSTVPNRYIFEYPMVLGPAVIVPVLLSWNIIVAVWALS